MKLIPFAVILAVITVHSIPAENDRFRHAPCKILISEIKILHQHSDFVEVAKFCPTPGRSNDFTGLDGYYILIINGTNQFNVHAAYNLDGKHLGSEIPVIHDGLPMSKKRGRKRTRTNANPETPNVEDENILSSDRRTSFTNSVPPGRTLASANVPTQRLPRTVSIEFANLLNNQSLQMGSNTTETTTRNHLKRKTRSNRNIMYNPLSYFYETISTNHHYNRDEIVVVCLLHFKQSGRKEKNVDHFKQGNTITAKDIANIGTKLKDVVLIGSEIPAEITNDLRRIHDKLLERPIPVSENGFSINKCDQSPDIFNTIAYQYSQHTPGRPNSCTQLHTEEENYPFGFAGQSIKSHGQKLVINVLWSLEHKNIPEILKKGPTNAASALLNLNEDTIKRFQKRYEENSIGIEKEKRNPPKPVQDIIDEPKKRMLYEILVSYYKANKVPRMNEVREKFIQQVRTEQLQNPTSEIPAILFHCGVNTFRKILYSNGYKYGKINKRDAVLFDPRIVAWRGKYLKAIQDNDILDDGAKLPVIYTDETWFDIYSRQSYGWVPRCAKTVQERKDFTFLKHKASRGPRIIIMHAGGENGFVDGMMDVYAVSKKDAAGDYHDNINNESYMKWFQRLMKTLEGLGPHIIVIYNAPYHSVSTAPSVSNRKQVLLDWLTTQKQNGKQLPELTSLRKFELDDLVKKLKSEEPHFCIDDLARKHGHKVLRTPPYNCQLNPIELVWSDVKRLLREQNTDQNLEANIIRAKNSLQTYTADSWKRHVGHVKKTAILGR